MARKFNHLHVPDQWNNYFTRYPQGYTILESLLNWVTQVDDMVDNQNELNKKVSAFRGELDDFIERFDPRLQEEVTNILREWQESGFLDVVIDEALQTKMHNLQDYVERTTPEIHVEAIRQPEETDQEVIERALQMAFDNDGGVVRLAPQDYHISKTIHVWENVELRGEEFKTNVRYTENFGICFIHYHKSQLLDFNLHVPQYYNDTALLTDNQYVNAADRKDQSTNVRGKINVRFYKQYAENTPNCIAIKLKADSTKPGRTTGFWGVTYDEVYMSGFNTCIEFETLNAGWINSNKFLNVSGINAEHFIVVKRSADSAGIDWNEFESLTFQVGDMTKDVLVDRNSTNIYRNPNVWDLQHYPNARFGIARNLINIQPNNNTQSLVTRSTSAGAYRLVGRFHNADNDYVNVTLRFVGNMLDVDSLIAVDGKETTTRRNFGSRKLHEDLIKFYQRDLGDGTSELYFSCVYTWEVNVFIEAYVGFTPSPSHNYSGLSGLREYPNNITLDEEDLVTDNVVKLANGLMIIQDTFTSESVTLSRETSTGLKVLEADPWVVYPEPFVSPPSLSFQTRGLNPLQVEALSRGRTGFRPRFISEQELNEQTFDYTAIGRWK